MKKTRREERREETIQEIKNLAWQQLAEVGADQLSLRKISRDMRMSSAALFRYFDCRQVLLTALIQDAFESMNQAIAMDVKNSAHLSVQEQILTACRAYRTWAKSHPAHYAMIYGSPLQDYSPDWISLALSAQGSLEIFIELITNALQNGEISIEVDHSPLDPNLLNQLQTVISSRKYETSPKILYTVIKGWTILHGIVSLEVFNHINPLLPDPSELFEQTINDLLQHIGFSYQVLPTNH